MADDFGLLNEVDKCAETRNRLRAIAAELDEYAGIPFTLEGGAELIIEPSYPWAKIFKKVEAEPEEGEVPFTVRNRFYSFHHSSEIVVFQEADGRITWGKLSQVHGLRHLMATLESSAAWGIEQEHRALTLLGSMVTHHQMKTYLLTGAFIERSKRSGVFYLFRKLRPTVAITNKGTGFKKHRGNYGLRLLCALCMHPIGYYEDSWAGAMCPTDDVVAHLAMMRADEHMFWRRANQHPAFMSAAGL